VKGIKEIRAGISKIIERLSVTTIAPVGREPQRWMGTRYKWGTGFEVPTGRLEVGRFRCDKEVEMAVRERLRIQDANSTPPEFFKLLPRWNKYINVPRIPWEKLWYPSSINALPLTF